MSTFKRLVEVASDGIVTESTFAILLKFDKKDIWIPKSLIDSHDVSYQSIVIPEWLATEKEIDMHITDTEIEGTGK